MSSKTGLSLASVTQALPVQYVLYFLQQSNTNEELALQ